ncbi:hypothetical protein BKA61DRAFT_584249 [Leptodontidium sp. MPI-SDFR-AT-0119]|nr:hypothetical protein BKA61DRAFT_584249 [Leptodontidium sp. MPI-SDFR-AT-0119]
MHDRHQQQQQWREKKIPELLESSLGNGGKATHIVVEFAKGAHAEPHYHTDYEETFELLQGAILMSLSPDMTEENLKHFHLELGKPVTVPRNTLHAFVVTEPATRANISMTPGSLGWEQVIAIMRGARADGLSGDFGSLDTGKEAIFPAIMSELTNTIYTGEAEKNVTALRAARGAEVSKLRDELLAKYATNEKIKAAAGL